MNPKPNIFLVHGAWADASCWHKVILLLEAKGFHVTAAQISLNSLEDDIAVSRRLLSLERGPTVVVGHSYGGAVITGAAAGNPDVKALVYITAFGIDEGESAAALLGQFPPTSGGAFIAPDPAGYLWIKREGYKSAFANDVTADEAAVGAATQRPISVPAFTGVSAAPAWKTIPSWYLHCTEDNMIPPAAQDFMAKRMNATVSSVASSHSPFLSKPEEVAQIILDAASA